MNVTKSVIISIFEGVSLATNSNLQLGLFSAVLLFSISSFGSQLDCRSKTAYVVAKVKAGYSDQIPNETIEFAKSAAMKMCVSMANTTKLKTRSPVPEKINDSKEKKRSFLGINFGSSERKKGNERLMNRR